MPVDFGLRLVDAVLRHGKIQPVIEAGVASHMLYGTARAAYEIILQYGQLTGSRGTIPTREEIRGALPGLQFPGKSDDEPPSLETLSYLVKRDYIEREMERSWGEIHGEIRDDPIAALEKHQRTLSELKTSTGYRSVQDHDTIKGLSKRMQDYQRRLREGGGIIGVPYPWEDLSYATTGICGGDVVLIYGVPKSMKTWVALKIITHAYLESECRILCYTPEINREDIEVRVATLLAQLPYDWTLRGFPEDQAEAEEFFYETLRLIEVKEDDEDKAGQRLMLLTGDLMIEGPDPVAVFEDKIHAYEPRIIFIDSAYMLTPDRDWKVISRFLSELKKLGVRTGVAFVLTSQENVKSAIKAAHAGKDPGQSTIGFSQSMTEICDVGMRCIKKKRGLNLGFLLSLHLTAARKANLDGITIYGDPGHNMEFHSRKLISMEDTLDKSDKDDKPRRQPVRQTGVSIVDRVDQWER